MNCRFPFHQVRKISQHANDGSVFSFRLCDDLSSILDLKSEYLKGLVAPMDGMWESGLIGPSQHSEIRRNDERIGYFAVNEKGTLLQFYLRQAQLAHGATILNRLRAQGAVSGAVAFTIDPCFLSLCLDQHQDLAVQTFLYQHHERIAPESSRLAATRFQLLEASDLTRCVTFQQSCLGNKPEIEAWLNGYSANLIERGELSVLSLDGEWVGLGECRVSDSQAGVCDVGVMVSPKFRKQGWASHILRLLVEQSIASQMRPICSTTLENIGSQKAIERAGFVTRHRVLDVVF